LSQSSPRRDGIRLNAFLASAGLGSRRSVEVLIQQGKVSINGQIVRDLSTRVDPSNDQVSVSGRKVQPQPFRYVMLHKPPGFACTHDDVHATKTIYDLLPKDLSHLRYAGRLDVPSEGLLLLSNDGDWINRISHPSQGVIKVYEVHVKGSPSSEALEKAKRGIRSEGELLRVEAVRVLRQSPDHSFVRVELREGKKREIRRIFDVLGHRVLRLQRVSIGRLKLSGLRSGAWRELTHKEVAAFR
jgi:23S rRNA pseudouridine2605 synthase